MLLEGTDFQFFTEKAITARFSSRQDFSQGQSLGRESLGSANGSVAQDKVQLLEQDSSEAYASDMFMQCQSEEVSGLHSGIVVAKKGPTGTVRVRSSVSR